MVSTASALLKLELQTTGENDSTWGDKLNALFQRVEDAIAGVTPVTVTTANVTLTDTDFVANEARRAIIAATGVKTGDRAIIVPARTKIYVVDNSTTGAFTLTVKTPTGAGPTIPQGGKAIVYCDGTDVIPIVDTTTAVDIVSDTTPQLGGDLDANASNVLFDDNTGIHDDSDNEMLLFGKVASAVNYTKVTNAATGNGVVIASLGEDTDIDIVLTPKGAGSVNLQDKQLRRPDLRDYAETVNAIGGIGGGTQDIDLELGNVVTATVDTSETTFTFSNPPATGKAGSFTLNLTNGGSQTVNWPASVDWAGGVAPSLTTAGVDVLSFVTTDGGTTWLGFVAGLDMK